MVREKKFLLLGIFVFIFLSLGFVSATPFLIKSVSPNGYINRSTNTLINFTINNTAKTYVNITQVIITLPPEAIYYAESNGTTASATFFRNTTGDMNRKVLTWTNVSTAGFVNASGQTQDFWFNASLTRVTGNMFKNITIFINDTTNVGNITTYTYIVNFAFSGYVKNETGSYQNGTNISIYQFTEGRNGPPTEIFESSVLANNSGFFSFSSINGSATGYKLKFVHYNGSGSITKVGSILPSFPPEMYYPMSVDIPEFVFMIPPCLNGTTFYLQPASVLRLSATNFTTAQKFGYQVIDQSSGFPIESNVLNSVTTKDIVVPTGRNYTIMFTRMSSFGSSGFNFKSYCDGSFMNNTDCPTPPISNSSVGTLTEGAVKVINQSLVITQKRLYGCINVSTGYNNTALNITSINPKLIPWPGFIPPVRADMGNINLSDGRQLNYSVSVTPMNCSGYLAYYNISVIGSTSGINYMMEFYAKNASNEAGNPSDGWNLASFQNVSVSSSDINMNITLYRLLGNYISTETQGTVNTSKMKINIQNSSGGAITNNLNANIKVKNPVFGTETYIIESMSSGSFYFPILNNSNWAKITIFANDAPPKEITLNLSVNENNITLVTMADGRGVGMKRINSSGNMEMINTTQLSEGMAVTMRFLRNSDICNVITPSSDCELITMSAKNFNPLTAMVAGKINLEMKINSTNVTLTFFNFDMFSAKQPPMDSIINDQASGGASTKNQTWQFGSFAPVNSYDYVVIGMPYSDSIINETNSINLSTPLFYDESWNVIWNSSRGDTSANLTDDFIDYNSSSLYRSYLTRGGINCSKVDSTLNVIPCFVNSTSNMIFMKIPHFSGAGPAVSEAVPLVSAASVETPSSGSSSDTSTAFWSSTYVVENAKFLEGYTRDLGAKERMKVIVGLVEHYVGIIDLTGTTVTVNVSSTPQQAIMNTGAEKKFDVNSDGYYDIDVKLNSIASNKANIYVKSIYEMVSAVPLSNNINNTNNTLTQIVDTAKEVGKNVSETAGKAVKKYYLWALWAVIGIAIVIFLLWLVRSFSSKRSREKYVVFSRK